jgi:hypothetical protein
MIVPYNKPTVGLIIEIILVNALPVNMILPANGREDDIFRQRSSAVISRNGQMKVSTPTATDFQTAQRSAVWAAMPL